MTPLKISSIDAKWPPALKRVLPGLCLAIVLLAAAPGSVRADDEPEVYDARLQGYEQTVQLQSSSTALTWLLLVALGVVCVSVLFKDAKRTHLD